MNYICADRGSVRCPCRLMEAGQCYTCTMVRDGICSCEDAAGWQGVCPYTEYMQQGARVLELPKDCISKHDVLGKIRYAPDLYVVKLAVPRGMVECCMRPGTYVMAETMGWRTPISVLRASILPDGTGTAEFLVKAAGPKTMTLTAEDCTVWNVAGPYLNGLLNGEVLMRQLEQGSDVLVIARGTAAAPLVNLLHCPEFARSSGRQYRVLLDDEALPEAFKEEYLNGWVYERISLADPEGMNAVKLIVEETLQTKPPAVLALLVSQYYVEKLTEGLSERQRQRIALPNPANMCCSMGLCGACSYTDRDGVTVRLCKCSRTVIE